MNSYDLALVSPFVSEVGRSPAVRSPRYSPIVMNIDPVLHHCEGVVLVGLVWGPSESLLAVASGSGFMCCVCELAQVQAWGSELLRDSSKALLSRSGLVST